MAEKKTLPGLTTEIDGRKILFENDMCRQVGVMASCNSCDRIVFEDENPNNEYQNNGGYCPDCANEDNNGVERFLFGEAVCKAYDENGVDGVRSTIMSGEGYALFAYDHETMSGDDLLDQYDGWGRWRLISKEEYLSIGLIESK